VDQVLLHALPVRQPERLVLIDWQGDQVGNGFGTTNLMSYPICRDLDQQKQFFEGVFCRALTTVNLSIGSGSYPATAEVISGNYFPVLGVGPALGQVLTNDDDHAPNANSVAVLSYDFWQAQFAGASDVVGRSVRVNGHPLTVIGVAARTFHGIDVGEVPALWIPASMSTAVIPGFNDLFDRRTYWMQVLGRLNPSMTLQHARAGLQPWFKAMLHEDMGRPGFPVVTPESRQRFLDSSLTLTPAPQGHSELRQQLSEPLWMLFVVTTVLLGLVCLNVSGLFLARASTRAREVATRLALGASSGRLARQLLAESSLIALTGGLLGLAAAPIAVRVLIAFIPQGAGANALHAGIDSRLLLFTLLASVIAGFMSGLAPACQSGRRSLVSSLRERGGPTFGHIRLRKIIVTTQIALALTLVVGAGLFVRTLDALMAKGPGFVTSSLVSFDIDATREGYSTPEGEKMMGRIDEAIHHSPIIQASAIARFPLLTGGSWNNAMTIFTGQRITTDDVNLNAVTPEFFTTMGIRLLAGRNFDDHDISRPGQQGWRSAIVSQTFVRRYLAGRNPLGMRICEGTGPDVKPTMEIVGVMSDFSYRGLRDNTEQAYFPFYEGEHPLGTFYVRVRGTPEPSLQSLRAIVHSAAPSLPMTDFRTLDEQVRRSLNTERMLATLSGSFSTLALLLSLVGLYGVMSFVVTQRTYEIGLRLALGARRWSAIWLVLRDGLVMIVSGIAIGLPLVLALGRLVESQLYQVKSWDPAVIAIAILALWLAGLGATLLPACRASGINPTDALRVE
jgi:predicted permease